MEKLLTQQDLAERWQVTTETITNWRKEGVITPAKDIPAIRFTEQHILELEGVKLEKVSPLMYRRLEKEKEELEEENRRLKEIVRNVLVQVSPIISIREA